MKKKLCIIYNFAQKYREGVFSLIDTDYDCTWYFGTNKTDIKGFDLSNLHNAKEIRNVKLFGNWYWQEGALGILNKQNDFLLFAELYCLSTWLFALLAKFYPKKKVYFWSHGWYGKENFAKRFLKKIFFRLPKGTFLYGNYARELMIKEGFNENKLFVIHNSLNYEAQIKLRNAIKPSNIYADHFGNNNKTLLFIGRLTEVKRLDMLIQAVANLQKEDKQYNIVLVGDGVMKDALKKQAAEAEVNVWFYGACYDERTNAELIYNADLCVAPGNVGLTAMHTMVFGTPVITHNDFKWQMPEFEAIKPGKTGDFFTRGDVDSLARTIEHWFNNHTTNREQIREACYNEIDTQWTPQYQLSVINHYLDI